VPERHLAFEADGPHHELFRQEHDARRDCELTERFQLPVVRLTAQELDPWRQ
jgi:very-short-patch-repair endonuclease